MTKTYLGYQVRHLPEQSSLLTEWLESHSDRPLSIWGKTPTGSGCDYGTRASDSLENYPWGNSDIKCFEDKGDSCEFCTINESFVVATTQLPSDRWGNTATFESINLEPGCFQLGYSDAQYSDFNLPELPENLSDLIDDAQSFVEWVKEHAPELVDVISETTVCNGTASEWQYFTSNQPLTTPEWMTAMQRYADRD